MPLYRPPEADGARPGDNIRDVIRRAGNATRGGRRPALEDTSRPGNRTDEIAAEAAKLAGVKPPIAEQQPARRTAEEFNAGYEGLV